VREREFALVKAGRVQQVEPKAFRVLLMLIWNPNKLITKEELLTRVWGDTAVTENSLARNIALLRRLLGDDPREPRFIETVSSIGYRFLCPVEACEEPAGILDTTRSEDLRGLNGRATPPANGNIGTGADVSSQQTPANVAGVRREAIALSSKPAARWALGAVAVLVGVGLALWLYGLRHRHPLTDKGSIVLADFTNKTGDPVFDDTLREGLSVQLEQSPFLSVISDQQIQKTLEMMTQRPDARLTPEIASQICVRTGSAAVLTGSIAQIGTRYSLILKVVNFESGDLLASTEDEADNKNSVLDALSEAATAIRRKLGESKNTVQKFNTPLEQATTPSLEALKTYSMGCEMFRRKGNHSAAVPFLQRAIMLDHNFAMAYAVLGTVYGVLGETSLSIENTMKAYELRESVSEQERFYIETHYYDYVTEDIEKSRQVYELWAQTYPRDWTPRNNLAAVFRALGQYDRSLSEFREGLRLAPESAISNFNLVYG
jgi:DNA-binding winged helix-turn-helix (wHTH) protein/tetratricopeptide (TPR) repeat protein